MSNLAKAYALAIKWVESMGGLEAIRHDYNSDLSGLIQALDEAGLLAPDVQVIRTVEELEALDPDTVTIDNRGALDTLHSWLGASGKTYPVDNQFLPAVVVSTGAQVHAARKALEEDDV